MKGPSQEGRQEAQEQRRHPHGENFFLATFDTKDLLEPIDIFALPMTVNKYHDTAVIGTLARMVNHGSIRIITRKSLVNKSTVLSKVINLHFLAKRVAQSARLAVPPPLTVALTQNLIPMTILRGPTAPALSRDRAQTSHFSLHLNSHESLILETRPFFGGTAFVAVFDHILCK